MLQIHRFDPAQCQFPRPRAPLLPTLRWGDLTFGQADSLATGLLDGPGVWHFSRGRYALQAAYRAAGVGSAGALLAPAYHCRTMLDPALALGGAVHLYAQNPDLTPKMDTIEAIVQSEPSIRALVIPHYFGIEQPGVLMRELADFCRRHAIMLVEDCSHAWQVAARRASLCQAAEGHAVVASPYKFFACADGGTLWGNPAQMSMDKQAPPAIVNEAKALKAALQQVFARARPPAPAPAPDADQAAERGAQLVESSDQPSAMYSRALEGQRSLALSRWVMRRTRLSTAVQGRRRHYGQWADALRGVRGGEALFPTLPADCAPYMFPLRIAAPDPVFFQLKQSGVPIFRWDELALSDCAVAAEYRLHLLHLPCHQSLSTEQMRWMTTTVAGVLA